MIQTCFLIILTVLNIETNLNEELEKVSQWLFANKLSLNIEKNSFVAFHSPQRRMDQKLNPSISNMSVKSVNQIKYLRDLFLIQCELETILTGIEQEGFKGYCGSSI